MNKTNEKKRDLRFFLELSFFVALLYGISSCVFLNGDDFMYATFAQNGILKNIADYYITGNGRFWINIADSVLLWFDRYAFIVLLPWVVVAFIVLLAKNIQRIMSGCSDRNKEKNLIRVGMVLFTCLDVMCLRETVFWITGMMNYLFPATLFLFGYLLFQKSRAGEIKGLYVVGYYLVCILASSSVDQYALMFVGMMTLHHGYDIIKKKHINLYEWIVYMLALVSLASLLFAPATFVRIEDQGAEMPPFLHNVWTLFHQCTISQVASPFVAMLSLSLVLFSCKSKKDSVIIESAIAAVVLNLSGLVNNALLGIAALFAVALWVAFRLLISKTKLKEHIWFLFFVGIGSQVMLLISAVWGFRCMLSLYVVYMLVIGCLLYNADPKDRNYILTVGVLTAIHPVAAIVFCAVIVLKNLFVRNLTIESSFAAIISCAALISLLGVLIGYAQNVPVYRKNLDSTHAQEDGKIVIKQLPNETYSWYFVPFGEFHEDYFRMLHGISEDIEIIYEVSSD